MFLRDYFLAETFISSCGCEVIDTEVKWALIWKASTGTWWNNQKTETFDKTKSRHRGYCDGFWSSGDFHNSENFFILWKSEQQPCQWLPLTVQELHWLKAITSRDESKQKGQTNSNVKGLSPYLHTQRHIFSSLFMVSSHAYSYVGAGAGFEMSPSISIIYEWIEFPLQGSQSFLWHPAWFLTSCRWWWVSLDKSFSHCCLCNTVAYNTLCGQCYIFSSLQAVITKNILKCAECVINPC